MNESVQSSKPFLEDQVAKKNRRSLILAIGVFAFVCLVGIFLQIAVSQLNEEIKKSNDTIVETNKNIEVLKTQSGVVAFQILAGAKNEMITQIEKSQVQLAVRELKKISQNAQFNVSFEGFTFSKGTIGTNAKFIANQEGNTNAVEFARRFIEHFRNGGNPVFTLWKISSVSGDDKVRSFAVEFKWNGVNPQEVTKK